MMFPGAATLTHRFDVLKPARSEDSVAAPTAITSEWIAGISGALRFANDSPRLPAAATSTTPLVVARWIAAASVVGNSQYHTLPSDMLITSAPPSTATLIACANDDISFSHSGSGGTLPSGILIDRIVARGAIPATAIPFSATAPAIPATCVPCPL